eukprot:PhF_6_TR32420/c0_g1_i1/m.48110
MNVVVFVLSLGFFVWIVEGNFMCYVTLHSTPDVSPFPLDIRNNDTMTSTPPTVSSSSSSFSLPTLRFPSNVITVGGGSALRAIVVGPPAANPRVWVADTGTDSVYMFHVYSGSYLGRFARYNKERNPYMQHPYGIAFDPQQEYVFVSSQNTVSVTRYVLRSGVPLGPPPLSHPLGVVVGMPTLVSVRGIAISSGGILAVADVDGNQIVFVRAGVSDGVLGKVSVPGPIQVAFLHNGYTLLITSKTGGTVFSFDVRLLSSSTTSLVAKPLFPLNWRRMVAGSALFVVPKSNSVIDDDQSSDTVVFGDRLGRTLSWFRILFDPNGTTSKSGDVHLALAGAPDDIEFVLCLDPVVVGDEGAQGAVSRQSVFYTSTWLSYMSTLQWAVLILFACLGIILARCYLISNT